MWEQYAGISLTPAVAAKIIQRLFEQQSHWTTDNLWTTVNMLYTQAGGLPGQQHRKVLTKALNILRKKNIILNIRKGAWRSATTASISSSVPSKHSTHIEPITVPITPIVEPKETADELTILKQIGEGDELVYVYYFKDAYMVAQYENKVNWPCKLGYTTLSIKQRLLETKTGQPALPVVGLIINTNKGNQLEALLHAALKYQNKHLKTTIGCGDEWFETTPDEIEELYVNLQTLLID